MMPWEKYQQDGPWQKYGPDATDQGAKNFAAEMNPLQAVAVGAGRGFERLDSGIRQPLYEFGAKMGFPRAEQKRDELAASDQEAKRLYAPMQEAHPFASGIGETLPAFAVPVGGATSVLGAMGRMALPGAAQALLSYGSPEERLKDAALQGAGGAIGGGLTTLAGKIVSPAIKAATPELQGMAQTAKAAGITLNPAQLTGGKFAQGVQSALDTIPWTAGAQQVAKDAQQQAFNKSVLKSVGADAARATPDVLADAAATVGSKFEAGYSGVTVPINQTTKTLMNAIKNKYAQRLDAMQKPIVANIVDDLKAAGNTISGEQYHGFVSDIAQAARNVSDKKTQGALKSLRKVLDDSFKSAAQPGQAATYFEARGQWKNLLTIEEALKNGRSVSGDIPAKQFYAAMQKTTPNFVRGSGGELGEMARSGRQFLPDPIANSGTPFRTAFTNLLSAGTMGGAGAGVSALSGGDPMDGLKLGLLGYGASKGAQKIFNSGYPANQLLSEEMKRLLMRGGGLLGTGAAAGLSGN